MYNRDKTTDLKVSAQNLRVNLKSS